MVELKDPDALFGNWISLLSTGFVKIFSVSLIFIEANGHPFSLHVVAIPKVAVTLQ
jgi:hypothetical protein